MSSHLFSSSCHLSNLLAKWSACIVKRTTCFTQWCDENALPSLSKLWAQGQQCWRLYVVKIVFMSISTVTCYFWQQNTIQCIQSGTKIRTPNLTYILYSRVLMLCVPARVHQVIISLFRWQAMSNDLQWPHLTTGEINRYSDCSTLTKVTLHHFL